MKPQSDYWKVRERLQEAVTTNDIEEVEALSRAYPDIFKNVLNQAKNAKKMKKRRGGKRGQF